MTATQAPTPGPLDSESVKLLVKGDLLRVVSDEVMPAGSIVTFTELDFDDTELRFAEGDGLSWMIDRFAFIGRPGADGWMPWSGGENPVPGRMVDFEDGTISLVNCLSDTFDVWDKPGRFRLAPTAPVEASGSELGYEIGGVVQRLHDCLDGATKASVAVDKGDLKAALTAVEAQLNNLQRPFDNVVACEASDLRTIISNLRPQPSGETREVVARMIDPHAWAKRQERIERAEHWVKNPDGFKPETAEDFRQGNLQGADDIVRKSLELADRILALLSARPLALGGQQGVARWGLKDDNGVIQCLTYDDETSAKVAANRCSVRLTPFPLYTTPARAEAQDEGAAGEPVAWRYRWKPTPRSQPGDWCEPTTVRRPEDERVGYEEQALYAHPSPTPAGEG